MAKTIRQEYAEICKAATDVVEARGLAIAISPSSVRARFRPRMMHFRIFAPGRTPMLMIDRRMHFADGPEVAARLVESAASLLIEHMNR